MKVEFLNAAKVHKRLARLIRDHEEYHWAVAWATETELSKDAFANRNRFKNVVIGVDFSQTDPAVVDALVGVKNGLVATEFATGTYHPKVYGFRSADEIVAIVGSSNFTRGGLGRNLEGAVQLTGKVGDQALDDILEFVANCRKYGRPATPAYASAYRASWERARKLPRAPRNPVSEHMLRASTNFMDMEWSEYARRVRTGGHHNVAESLDLLMVVRRWFAATSSFADFSVSQRKAVAGIAGQRDKDGPELNRDWGWFGSMRGAGDFANRISENDKALARAVDGIPRSGEVSREQYSRFCDAFTEAFANSTRTGGVATASRLLAMKRPDTFLCISKPNREGAAEAMAFTRKNLSLEDYWEQVVEVIRHSKWFNSPKPDGADGELWEARAAMLDAIFYSP